MVLGHFCNQEVVPVEDEPEKPAETEQDKALQPA